MAEQNADQNGHREDKSGRTDRFDYNDARETRQLDHREQVHSTRSHLNFHFLKNIIHQILIPTGDTAEAGDAKVGE